jgi:hypothetical protein
MKERVQPDDAPGVSSADPPARAPRILDRIRGLWPIRVAMALAIGIPLSLSISHPRAPITFRRFVSPSLPDGSRYTFLYSSDLVRLPNVRGNVGVAFAYRDSPGEALLKHLRLLPSGHVEALIVEVSYPSPRPPRPGFRDELLGDDVVNQGDGVLTHDGIVY